MKFAFLVIAVFINFLNHSLIKSEEIFSAKNKIENFAKNESINEEKTEIKKNSYCKKWRYNIKYFKILFN